MNALENVIRNLDWGVPLNMLMRIVPALICITLHELGHGVVAYWLGDRTAKDAGRLTLNPIRHIDWQGLVMMILFRFGWAKPVPVNMMNFKNPKRGMAITALAGPVVNVLITVVFLFLYGILYRPLLQGGSSAGQTVLQLVITTAYLSLSLAIFNLLPISPLDGSKIAFSFLSDESYVKLMRYERYGMILLILLVATGATSGILPAITGWVYDKLFFIVQFGYNLVNR